MSGIIWTNKGPVLAKLAAIDASLGPAMRAAADEVGESWQTAIRSHLYPGHGYKTGALYGSYQYKVSGSGYMGKAKIATNVYYAIYQEFAYGGLSPHFYIGTGEVNPLIPGIMEKHLAFLGNFASGSTFSPPASAAGYKINWNVAVKRSASRPVGRKG